MKLPVIIPCCHEATPIRAIVEHERAVRVLDKDITIVDEGSRICSW